ncbi:MAG TPA: hypothetical protein VK062_07035 [Burkholderiaceae bacterium]|nr:hypothetical protein [Burkholderiaceae bacterium]
MKHHEIRERSTGRTARVPEPLAVALVAAGKHEYVDGRKAKKLGVSPAIKSHHEDDAPAKPAKPAKKTATKRAYKRRDLKAED